MSTYIRLIRLTAEGRKAIKSARSVVEKAAKIFQENGGKVVSSWGTLGSYDFVAIVEAPDDKAMMKISALISATGIVVAETLPAVPMDKFLESVG